MNIRLLIILILVIAVMGAVWFALSQKRGPTRDLAGNIITDEKSYFSGSSKTETLKNDDTQGSSPHEQLDSEATEDDNSNNGTKETNIESPTDDTRILITDGVKHTVPLSSILSGGPPKDGIPSIDNPKFISVSSANKEIDDEGLGIAVSFNGIDRFYPNQILVWHEIVNDTIGGQPVLITYCPLCGTGIVFNPLVDGKQSEFGTSGKLWNSNLVMYDRQTESYWSQVLGRSIVGSQAGDKLTLLPYQNITYADWKKEHPQGEVLSTDTGFFRNYNSDPYGGYYTNRDVFFPVDNTDDRYHPKEFIYGVEIDNNFKAYPQEELKKSESVFRDTFAGLELELAYNKNNQTLIITNLATGAEVVPVFGFWFSWISVHPETEVYTAP